MWHLLLILPLLGLALFGFLPWQTALPLYLIILAASLGMYWKIILAQRQRPLVGKSAMVGDQAIVVRLEGNYVVVNYEGELWRAVSSQPLHHGQQVIIENVEGLALRVVPSKHGDSAATE
ncbi:MAG: NfeD family protein [Syntrophobacteraceae bacterium]